MIGGQRVGCSALKNLRNLKNLKNPPKLTGAVQKRRIARSDPRAAK
jgi:hypothetical protein